MSAAAAVGTTVVSRAPGRVNLIGEHTDYNGGWVMPMAVDQEVRVTATKRADQRLTLASKDFALGVDIDGSGALAYDEARGWANYVLAVLWALREKGWGLGGYDLKVESNLWKGTGLSSSAALEMAVARAICALDGVAWDPMAMALLCQRAENKFIGVNCGIMDQAAVGLCGLNTALLLNCDSLKWEQVAVNFSGAAFVITNSAVERGLRGGEYNARRQGCEAAVSALRRAGVDIPHLAALSEADLQAHAASLPEGSFPLARHIVTETRRTLEGAEALRQGDAARFGKLMTGSHASLRDDYRVSCPELDHLVEAALAIPGVFGSRLTGAGFGGCTVSLVEKAALPAFSGALPAEYRRRTGLEAKILVLGPAEAAGLVA